MRTHRFIPCQKRRRKENNEIFEVWIRNYAKVTLLTQNHVIWGVIYTSGTRSRCLKVLLRHFLAATVTFLMVSCQKHDFSAGFLLENHHFPKFKFWKKCKKLIFTKSALGSFWWCFSTNPLVWGQFGCVFSLWKTQRAIFLTKMYIFPH